VLDGGGLAVPRLDAVLTINAGQARVAQTLAYGQGADLSIAASGDVADGSIDARLTLLGPMLSEGANSMRPEILVTLKGPATTPKRNVDVSTLAGVLMLRSVERQSRRIDTIEAERREAERREAERREIDRREAERRERERREAEARAVTSPAALPSPIVQEEAAPSGQSPEAPRAVRPPRPATPQAQPSAPVQAPVQNRAPTLPPPLNIGPAPGNRSGQAPATAGPSAAKSNPPPRSALETLFGVQR
jgi:hypothetical protein